jgi:hypothetical protein
LIKGVSAALALESTLATLATWLANGLGMALMTSRHINFVTFDLAT